MIKRIIPDPRLSAAEVERLPSACAWEGCEAVFEGDMPKGWSWLITYWSSQPKLHFGKIPPANVFRDTCLCPEHSFALNLRLKDS
jgi:hypothetical protein